MPSKQPYNLVKEDQPDFKNIYPDEAFLKGISFNVKVMIAKCQLTFQLIFRQLTISSFTPSHLYSLLAFKKSNDQQVAQKSCKQCDEYEWVYFSFSL